MSPGQFAFVGPLETYRARAGLSQADAAKRAGIHVRSLRFYEREGRVPSMETIHKLAVLYGVDPAQLLNEVRASSGARAA